MIKPLIEENADRGKNKNYISVCFSIFAFPSLWFTQEAAHLGWLTRLLKLGVTKLVSSHALELLLPLLSWWH